MRSSRTVLDIKNRSRTKTVPIASNRSGLSLGLVLGFKYHWPQGSLALFLALRMLASNGDGPP